MLNKYYAIIFMVPICPQPKLTVTRKFMSTVEIFSIIRDIAISGAACVTAYVAYTGLSQWQKELDGKAKFDVARQLAKSVYALRDQISYCRSPFTASHEFPEGYRGGLDKPTAEEEGQAWAHVYAKRWEPVGEAVQAFDTSTLEAEALWGKEIKEKALELRKSVRCLQVDIESFIRNKYSGGEDFMNDRDFKKEIEFGIWDVKPEENQLTQSINKAINDIESVIRPHLSRN